MPAGAGTDRPVEAPAGLPADVPFCGHRRRVALSGAEPWGRCGAESGNTAPFRPAGGAGGGRDVCAEFFAVKCR